MAVLIILQSYFHLMQKFNLERGRSWNVVFFDDNQIRKAHIALHRRNRSRI